MTPAAAYTAALRLLDAGYHPEARAVLQAASSAGYAPAGAALRATTPEAARRLLSAALDAVAVEEAA